ncbi:MAG: tRNA (guanosine(37)-N1)-methyltransferase TrmD [Candidatus Wolfebacteria bacterium]|nr:tRNA (guanosine(37)-N1)-methyltransferase TrmD [Candidatus Wolfebacteria bacterium]
MRFDIITIFPQIFDSYLNESILKRAQAKKLIDIKIHNLRDFTSNKHKKVDDKPFGGGPGMVLMAEPIIKAVKKAVKSKKTKVILFSAGGKQFDNKAARVLSKYNQLVFVCGRYEGVDERVKKAVKDLGLGVEEISIGPYVLTGGELPAMVLIDAISRQIKDVLGKQESLEEKRLGVGVPGYTRPEAFIFRKKKYPTPKVLLSGNHQKIEEWRRKNKK